MKLWKIKVHQILNEADTKPGLIYEYVLFGFIWLVVTSVALESVRTIEEHYGLFLFIIQLIVLACFIVEYFLRIIIPDQPIKYIFSFYGILDLLAILALSSVFFEYKLHFLVVVRILRFLRVFKVLKFRQLRDESNALLNALKQSGNKILIFVFSLVLLCTCFGTIMYLIEPEESGFTSIPKGIYWCIVTLTTVGYGDITPLTVAGKTIASFIMVIGYGVIAVSALIVTSEANKHLSEEERVSNTQTCTHCLESDHKDGALYCHACGNSLKDV